MLVTRARDMVHVLTSIPRGEYAALTAVPDGEQPGGRWLLYAYLRYAEELAEEFERDRERVAQLASAGRVGEVRVRPAGPARCWRRLWRNGYRPTAYQATCIGETRGSASTWPCAILLRRKWSRRGCSAT